MTLTPCRATPRAHALLALALCSALPALAQPDTQPPVGGVAAPDAPPPSADAAAQALKKKEGDVDQASLLRDTLTKADKQYSLLRAGRLAATYDLNYSYIGQENINVALDSVTGQLTLFNLSNTRAHTITNTVSVDYGLLDNLTLSVNVPLVSKFTQSETFSGITNAPGDISFGARFQPFSQTPAGPTLTVTSNLSLPTGRSPFKSIDGQNLATGSGYMSGSIGMNASQVVDPVALFGSINVTLADGANNLHQVRNDTILLGVKPGKSLGWGAGFTYALNYNISTSVAFQENVTGRSHLAFLKNNVIGYNETTQQVSALLNFGLGVRLSPKTTVNLTAGIGLTNDSPDFSLGLNLPLTFPSL